MSCRELSKWFFTRLGDMGLFCLTYLALSFEKFFHSLQAGFLGVLPGVVHGLDFFDASDIRIIPWRWRCNSVPCREVERVGVGCLLWEVECCSITSSYKEVLGLAPSYQLPLNCMPGLGFLIYNWPNPNCWANLLGIYGSIELIFPWRKTRYLGQIFISQQNTQVKARCAVSQKIKDKIIKHRAQISKNHEAYSSQRSIQNARLIQAGV